MESTSGHCLVQPHKGESAKTGCPGPRSAGFLWALTWSRSRPGYSGPVWSITTTSGRISAVSSPPPIKSASSLSCTLGWHLYRPFSSTYCEDAWPTPTWSQLGQMLQAPFGEEQLTELPGGCWRLQKVLFFPSRSKTLWHSLKRSLMIPEEVSRRSRRFQGRAQKLAHTAASGGLTLTKGVKEELDVYL